MNAAADAGTETSAATNAEAVADRRVRGSRPVSRRNTPYATTTVTTPMTVMFTPSAVSPPSAKKMPCISSTTERQSTAV